jgi:hypothetical protein
MATFSVPLSDRTLIHRIRTAKSSPIALWVSGQHERIVGMDMTNLEEYGVVSFGEDTDTGDVSENDRPIIDSLFSNIIDERCLML